MQARFAQQDLPSLTDGTLTTSIDLYLYALTHCVHCHSLSCNGCLGSQAVLRPVAQPGGGRHVLFEHFWVEVGDLPLPEPSSAPQFVMTPSVRGHLRNLARAVLVRRFPIVLQASAAATSTFRITDLLMLHLAWHCRRLLGRMPSLMDLCAVPACMTPAAYIIAHIRVILEPLNN